MLLRSTLNISACLFAILLNIQLVFQMKCIKVQDNQNALSFCKVSSFFINLLKKQNKKIQKMAFFSIYIVMQLVGGLFLALAGLYLYFKLVLYNYWRKHNVPYLEPSVPMGNLAPVVTGKINLGESMYANYNL